MLNVLKLDLYKILKSKTLYAFWILATLLIFLRPITTYVINQDKYVSVMSHLGGGGEITLAVAVFACLFTCKDYSSGYIKNLYGNINVMEYTLSKVICIAFFCLTYMIIEFIIDSIFNFIFGVGIIYNLEQDGPNFLVSGFLLSRLTYVLRGLTIGVFVMFLSTLIKKEYIVVAIVLIYLLFLSTYVNMLLFKLNVATGISFTKYVIFCNPVHNGWFDDYIFRDLLLPHIIFPVFYITIFTLFSWALLNKRNI